MANEKVRGKANKSNTGTGQHGNSSSEIWRGRREPLPVHVVSTHERYIGKHRENSIKPKSRKHSLSVCKNTQRIMLYNKTNRAMENFHIKTTHITQRFFLSCLFSEIMLQFWLFPISKSQKPCKAEMKKREFKNSPVYPVVKNFKNLNFYSCSQLNKISHC